MVLDKTPDEWVILPNNTRVKKKRIQTVRSRGPYSFFTQEDLYTTNLFGRPNREIEKFLFGRIDDAGKRAVDVFRMWPVTDGVRGRDDKLNQLDNPPKAFQDLLEYIDAQKIRTPKALRYLKTIAAKTGVLGVSQNQLLILMQRHRYFYTTMLGEGLWEIVTAHQSNTKFVFSDDPVTIYNCDHFPMSSECLYPYDPKVYECGSRTIFPLDMNNCLIISNIEFAKTPERKTARKRRRNARSFDQFMINILDIIKTRELTETEVQKLNYVIKMRAPRYVAAAKEEWLYPEKMIGNPYWPSLDEVMRHTGFAMKLAAGETVVKYQDESILFTNEFGERQYVPGSFVRSRKKE